MAGIFDDNLVGSGWFDHDIPANGMFDSDLLRRLVFTPQATVSWIQLNLNAPLHWPISIINGNQIIETMDPAPVPVIRNVGGNMVMSPLTADLKGVIVLVNGAMQEIAVGDGINFAVLG